MTAAELVVKIQADIRDLAGKLVEAGAEVKAFGNETEQSTSKMKTAWRDAETGLINFDRAQKSVRSGFNNGPLGMVGAIGDTIAATLKFGNMIQRNVDQFGQWVSSINGGAAGMSQLGTVISALAPVAGLAAIGVAALIAGIVIIPAIAAAAMFILQALADTIGTLGAIAYAALGPIGVFVAIIGGLGAAVYLAAQRAIGGKGPFREFGKTVAAVTKQFKELVTQLATDFLPLFERLANAAKIALNYFAKLAQMPLAQAFHSLATTGVKMLTKFLYDVGQAVAKPLRLAIRVAFDQGTAQNQIGNIVSSLGGYLFGKHLTVPVAAHRGAAQGAAMTPSFNPGALQPIVDWFNRHDFTKTGKRWGNEIINGFLSSGMAARLGNFLLQVFEDSAKRAGKTFLSVLYAELNSFPGWVNRMMSHALSDLYNAWVGWSNRTGKTIENAIGNAWKWMVTNASGEFRRIASNLSSMWSSAVQHAEGDWQAFTTWIGRVVGDAWNTVKTKAQSIWNQIISFIERPLTIHINWPSPPGWLNSLIGGIPGVGAIVTGAGFLAHHAAAGGIFTRPTHRLIGESGAEAVIPLTGPNGRHALGSLGGGGGVTININNPTFMSGGRPAARELARILKPELDRIVRSGR